MIHICISGQNTHMLTIKTYILLFIDMLSLSALESSFYRLLFETHCEETQEWNSFQSQLIRIFTTFTVGLLVNEYVNHNIKEVLCVEAFLK